MMDSQNFILGFVKIVERHPVLYDQKLPHRTPHLCSMTWEKVAEEVMKEFNEECSVDELKAKWKGIRSSYARFKRKIERSKDFSSKQYYLFDALNFLRPHTKHRPTTSTEKFDGYQSSDVEEWDSEMSVQMLNEDTTDDSAVPACIGNNLVYSTVKIEPLDEDQIVDTTDITNDNHQSAIEIGNKLKRKKPMDIFEGTTVKTQRTEENADLQFFKSILPDIVHFSKPEKRKLKMGVLKLIDEIENSRQDGQNVGAVYLYKEPDM